MDDERGVEFTPPARVKLRLKPVTFFPSFGQGALRRTDDARSDTCDRLRDI